ncbi:hypothetical protein LWI28_026270 [Acer negundo]|uniref:Uncharacterized protein n=1 Tax=Acer negundo TaxID=4023 RepID=A0AAD5IGF4_ACENE|nr:hypothetical protein LWI28_026270 [Acer negundo]
MTRSDQSLPQSQSALESIDLSHIWNCSIVFPNQIDIDDINKSNGKEKEDGKNENGFKLVCSKKKKAKKKMKILTIGKEEEEEEEEGSGERRRTVMEFRVSLLRILHKTIKALKILNSLLWELLGFFWWNRIG